MICAIFLLGLQFSAKLFNYCSLKNTVVAEIKSVEIVEKKFGKFHHNISYDFEFEKNRHQGVLEVNSPNFDNPYVLKDFIQSRYRKKQRIYFSNNNPNLIYFEKKFPYKEGLQLGLALAIGLYFSLLRAYVSKNFE
tara:strand:- start:7 stop:414 length:408 start_codon:yes stop_codon:yes gene_type:complete